MPTGIETSIAILLLDMRSVSYNEGGNADRH